MTKRKRIRVRAARDAQIDLAATDILAQLAKAEVGQLSRRAQITQLRVPRTAKRESAIAVDGVVIIRSIQSERYSRP